LVIKENEDSLQLLPNMLKPDEVETISKGSIEQRHVADVSTMPVGLLDTFTIEEVYDLLAYLQSSGVGP